MNLSAIFSKTGKGVQEASGKTSHLSRADRGVLKEIDGKTTLAEVGKKFEKIAGPKFEALIQQLDKDGFIREVSSGAAQPAAPVARAASPPPRAAPPPADSGDEALDFTQALKLPPKAPAAPPKAPPVDLAAAARAEAERKAKEQQAFDYKARQEAETKARAEAELKARAEAEARTRAETDAKVKAAREAAVRMATEAKAKTQAAEERARKEAEDKARIEAELKGKLEEERKAREDAERRAREAAEQARKEAEEKAKRDAEELRQRLEAEMKAKLEEERRAREEEDRKRREEEDRRRREEDERRRKEDEERRAKQEAERRAREEEDRKRREEDERRRKEEAERRARDEADRKRRKEDEERRAKEETERRAKEDSERRARDDEDRRRRDEEERKRREDDERRRRDDATAKEEAEAKARLSQTASQPAVPVPPAPAAAVPPPAAASSGSIGDSLLADLESFGQREEEEQRAKEEAERKAKAEAERKLKEEAERKAREEAEEKRREEEERRRKEKEERRAQEEAERRAREEEERLEQEEAERKRKAKEALAARQAEERAAKAAARKGTVASGARGDDDIGVTEDDLDMDDVKRDEKKLGAEARKAAREREQPAVAVAAGRPKKWGKPAAIGLFVALVGGIGALQVMPISTAEYEKAASEALGAPVKIGSARLSVITGVELNFERVSVGDAVKIRLVRGYPEIGSLFGENKAFSRLELEGASLSQGQLGDAVLGKASGAKFRVGRILIKQAKLDGPLTLPALDVEAAVSGDGSLQSVTLRGADKFSVQLSPKGNEIAFEIGAGSLALPFLPALTLSDFGMKGTATRQGVSASTFDGRAYDGVFSGTARIRWGASWSAEGEVRVRAVNVAVFAPALVSEGKLEGRGVYSMSGAAPSSLHEGARLEGNFKIEKGVLGSFDLTRALQTGGQQTSGRTLFAELNGQGVYDKGTVQLRNIALSAGAMNAGASLDVDANGGLAGRIAADVKTPNQTLRAMLNVSGKVQDPVIRK